MSIETLSFVEDIKNDSEEDLILFFEPRCEEIVILPKEEVQILAEIEGASPRFELKREGNVVAIHCLSSDVLWYVNKNGVVKPSMEWAYGITYEAMNIWHKNNKPWWKFW